MAVPPSVGLVLFVAGEPGPGPDLSGGDFWRMFRWSRGPDPGKNHPGSEDPPDPNWHLPPDTIRCVKLVFEVAREEHQDVTLVDVDRPSTEQALVDRWVRPSDTFPVLVRSDGRRLSGSAAFDRRRIRELVRDR